MNRSTLKSYKYIARWKGALALLVLYVALEFSTLKIGSDWGVFLYVTLHFVIMPLLSICVIVLTIIAAYHVNSISRKLILCSSIMVPGTILFIAFTGSTMMIKILGVDFNR